MENAFAVKKRKEVTSIPEMFQILLEKLTNIEIALTTNVTLEERLKIIEDELMTKTPSPNENKCKEDLTKVADQAMDSRIIERDEV